VDRAVGAARAALDGAWGRTPPNERARLLHALADAIQANRGELAELESRNVGKAISSVKAEVAGAVENFRFFGSVVGSIAGRSNPIGGSLLSYTLKEPVGVCAQIVPWNYPLLMSVWKLSPALAAGCAVVLKPDPQTPLSVLRVVEASVYDDFVARFAEAAKQLKVGDPLDAETQVGSLISAAHRDRVHGYVEKGREEGAEVVLGGEAGNGAGAFYLPTVLAGVESSMTVAQE